MYKIYKDFYHYLGIRKSSDFLTPKLIDISKHKLPEYSIVYIADKEYPNKSMSILNNIKNGYILNSLTYSSNPYNIHKRTINENSIVKKLNKKHNSIETITNLKKKILFKNITKFKNSILIYNYNEIEHNYVYKDNYDKDIWIFLNRYNTMIDDVIYNTKTYKDKKYKINNFIWIELPEVLYSLDIIKKYINGKFTNREINKVFYNEKQLLIFELYKIFDKTSILNRLEEVIESVNFVITYKENSVLLNMKMLLSISKDYNYENKNKFDKNTCYKMLFNLLHLIINSHADEVMKEKIIEDKKIGLLDSNNVEVMKAIVEKNEKELDNGTSEENMVEEAKLEDKVDDNVIKTDVFINKYDNKSSKEILKGDDEKIVTDTLEEDVNNGNLDKKKLVKLKSDMDTFLNSKSPFDKSKTVKEYLKITDEDLKIDRENLNIDSPVFMNKKELGNVVGDIDKSTIRKVYKKDILRTFVNLNKSGLIVKDVQEEEVEDVLGKYSIYNITVSDKGKSTYNIKLHVPTVNEDGTYKISSNTYRSRRQRTEVIIKKINKTTVLLTTAYGKINVVKAPMKKYDRGFKIRKELSKLADDKIVTKLMFGTLEIMDTKLPESYFEFSRYVKSFKFKSYNFDFNYTLNKDKLNKKLDSSKYTYIGSTKADDLVMDMNNIIYTYNNKLTEIGTLEEILDFNIDREYSFVKIFKSLIPVGLLLSYYLGLMNLLKLLNVKYEVLEGVKRVKTKDNIVIIFKDRTLVITPDNEKQKMLLGGLNDKPKIMRGLNLDILNNKELFLTIFKQLDYNISTITEIKVLENMFVDPNSKSILELMHEPTTFIGLLIRANELLVSDFYENPANIKSSLIKGYERIPQYIHKVFADAIRKKTSQEYFGRSKLEIDPYAVWRIMNEDSAAELVDDLNPISYLKQKEDVTVLGFNGLKKETLVGKTRAYDKSGIGVISEGVKDKTDVGITAYLSANPTIKNLRGMVDIKDIKDLDYSNIVSTNSMLRPFILADDIKRINYSNIQSSHVIPIDKPKVFPVRTSYASMLAYKLDANFVAYAKEEGKVLKVTANTITIDYKKSGKQTIKFHDWTSKEESNTTFYHKLVPNVNINDKVKPGDILYYDQGYFEPDMFDKTKVVYRTGRGVLTAFIEAEETREDSFTISEKLSKESKSSVIKVKDIKLKVTDNITDVIKINDATTVDTPLFTLVTDLAGDEKLDKATMELLQGFVKASPKAEYAGKLVKIQVFYNAEITDMTKSLKKLVEMSELFMVDKLTNKKFTGKVNSSYSVRSVPLMDGELHVKFFIETKDNMGTGDKAIFAHQLKATAANLFEKDYILETGQSLDAVFSYQGVYNRIVPSSDMTSSLATVLYALTNKAVDMYFNK